MAEQATAGEGQEDVSAINLSIVVPCYNEEQVLPITVEKLLERGYRPENIFLSLERNMSCGIGKCGHCRLGRYYVCKDGPVFSYEEIQSNPRLWED